jgi:hypothetical protein
MSINPIIQSRTQPMSHAHPLVRDCILIIVAVQLLDRFERILLVDEQGTSPLFACKVLEAANCPEVARFVGDFVSLLWPEGRN